VALLEKGKSLSPRDLDGAISRFEEAAVLGPSAATLSSVWTTWELPTEAGSPERAVECYDKALEADPSNSMAWVNKGSSSRAGPGRGGAAVPEQGDRVTPAMPKPGEPG